MKQKMFVIGDIHGQITMFKELLKNWDQDEEQLLLVGDLGDRGENPKACFELAKELVDKHDAICLRGNHEEMLLNFMNDPKTNAANYEMNGGLVTINSFLEADQDIHDDYELAATLQKTAPWIKPFIESLPLKYEWEDFLFVHAGVDLRLSDWKQTSDRNFVWIREGFYDQENRTGKTIVFGHTVTAMLHGNNSDTSIWETDDGKIGIDGGAVYGGTLHGIVLDHKGIVKQYSVDNTGYAFNDLLRKG